MASPPADKATLSQIAQRLFDDALHNIIHDIVIHRHRDHKLMIANLDPTDKLPHCETCKLPRLLDPPLAPKVRGATSDPPANTQYCDRKPWSRRPGHDIYDNPFPRSDITGRPPTKKEREAAKNSKKDDNTPASEDATQNGTAPPSPSANDDNGPPGKDRPLEKGEKKASKIDEKLKKGEYVPWHTCPSCKRSLLITRFAKHLEQCMGLSGRAASRNAMAKMNGTPTGSRGGTPNPSQEGEGGDEDEDGALRTAGGNIKKKLLKKGLDKKLKKEKEKGAGTTGKLPKGANKKTLAAVRSSPAPSSVGGEGKREREEVDDEDDEVHVKKRMKMQRVGSTASFTSSIGTGAAMERTESQDGSFVDDGSVAED